MYIFTTIKIFEKDIMLYDKRRKINRLTQIWVRSSTLHLAVGVYDKAGSKSWPQVGNQEGLPEVILGDDGPHQGRQQGMWGTTVSQTRVGSLCCQPSAVWLWTSDHTSLSLCFCMLLLRRFSRVWLCATPETAAHQAPPSLGFSRQEHWSGLPFPSPMYESENWKWSRSVVSDS